MVREEPKIERKNVIFINNFCIILFNKEKKELSEEDIVNEFKALLQSKNIEIIDYSEIKIFRKELLGKGGVGRVYKGKYSSSDVAIKEYFQYNLFDSFENEQTLSIMVEIINALALNIPKVKRCYDVSINENDGIISPNMGKYKLQILEQLEN